MSARTVVYGAAAEIDRIAWRVDGMLGLPRAGDVRGATGGLVIPPAPPGPGWTLTYADPVQAEDGQCEYPADVPAIAQGALVGLPRRMSKLKPEIVPVTVEVED
jgi:hypothetical protein